jgi:fumarylacetoacetase
MTSSWLEIPAGSPFTLANLPYGTFVDGSGESRLGVAIGDQIIDVGALAEGADLVVPLSGATSVDDVLRLDRPTWRELRAQLVALLSDSASPGDRDAVRGALVPSVDVRMVLPFTVRDYVDFYSSIEHATNLGRLMRPDGEPLLPNWRHLPVGYHGRSSTVVVSGTDVRRPKGQTKPADAPSPVFGPSRLLDFELEVGFVTGGGASVHGDPIAIGDAEDHIYGIVLVNDWSARDVQAWEYQPLGPFLAKSFATSISPWVVPLEALEPFRVPAPPQDPEPLPYLQEAKRRGIDLRLRVRVNGTAVTDTNFRDMYWTMAQQLAHMTVNGTIISPGDLYASGTVSGAQQGTQGSLIELTSRGANPITLDDGSTRTFLDDGDTVTIDGWCGDGDAAVGFGSVAGTVLPAR